MVKALILAYVFSGGTFYSAVSLIDNTGTVLSVSAVPTTFAGNTAADLHTGMANAAISYASGQGYTITAADVIDQSQGAIPVMRTYTYPTRTLNSAFQASTTQDVQVSYAVDVAATLSLTSGQTGTVVLEYADDSGITTNVKTVQTSINANTGTLAIGLGLTQTATASVSGIIPTGKYVRLRTVNTAGTPTFTFRSAQEVLL